MEYLLIPMLVITLGSIIVAFYFQTKFEETTKQLKEQLRIANATIDQQDLNLNKHFSNQKIYLETLEAKLKAEFALETQKIRDDAVKKSKIVNRGFDAETFSPFLQNLWNPKDHRHLGDPVDYIIFSGAENIRLGLSDNLDEIVIVDIKTGNADLSKIQRRIRDAAVLGRVSFAQCNPETKETRIWNATFPKGQYINE